MARARNLKPGFFENETLAETGPFGQVLFAGLWGLADREGRLEDRPLRIKAKVFPYYEADVDGLLSSLAERGFVRRYEVDGRKLIQITSFLKHQQPHYKEVASELAAPPGHADSQYVTFGVSRSQRDRILDRDQHRCVACAATDDLTMDHIVARSKGGSGDDDNLRTLCRRCNSSKNNREASANVGATSDQRHPNVGPTKSLDDLRTPDSGLRTPSSLTPSSLTPSSLTPDSGLRTPDCGGCGGADAPGAAAPTPEPPSIFGSDGPTTEATAEPPTPTPMPKPRTAKQVESDRLFERNEAYYLAYCRGVGIADGSAIQEQRRAQAFRELRPVLAANDLSPPEFGALAGYAAAAYGWRKGRQTPTVAEVVLASPEWERDGRPEAPIPKPSSPSAHDPVAYFSAMGRGEI